MSRDLEKGLYRYDPEAHALEEVLAWDERTGRLMEQMQASSCFDGTSEAAILITARFGRVSWKYESMAYATILKNTGALLQTMYLVATAMDLAPCAIGGGDAMLFSEIADTETFGETTVGEFLIGTKSLGPSA